MNVGIPRSTQKGGDYSNAPFLVGLRDAQHGVHGDGCGHGSRYARDKGHAIGNG